MDPLTALSTAAAVVQFADFGYRLVKNAHELYTSPQGQKSKHIELSIVSHDLSRLADAVEAKLGDNEGPGGEVLRLCRECASTNHELQEILGKLKARGKTKVALAVDSWRVTLKQVATADNIEKLANRLNLIRQQMNVALLYLLLDEAGKNGIELRQFVKQQADMIATLDRVDSTTKQFSTGIMGLVDKWPADNQAEVDEMVRYVLSDKWNGSEYAKRTLLDRNSEDADKLDKVCQSLYFESISYRETSIPKRHAATFEWIFHDPRTSEDGDPLWSNFPQWLREDSRDIYWITGKPGAGKSTLVKFFAQDPRFEQLLRTWAAGSQLLVARFFSWTSGANKLQKSHEGLFRTLLLEAIQQRPQLAIDIFPARWFLLQSFDGNVKLPAPTMDELVVGFRNLLRGTGEKFKLALLIDGLDEFDEDHDKLVQILRDANAAAGVKVCASSRPWNVFRDAYGNNPMLRLENLTREDIQSFVKEQLELSPGYHEFAATSPQVARKIIDDIVDKAQGVFLWVSVISGLLEADFREGAGISALQAVIDRLPSEVADLFRYIWDRTSKRFRAEASQFFQVMNASQDHNITLAATTLWFGDREIPIDLDATAVTNKYLTSATKSLERKLMSRTGGLLELVHSESLWGRQLHVEFMHRTANDWVRENWASITSATDPDFDARFWIVKGAVLTKSVTPKPLKHYHDVNGLLLAVLRLASGFPADHPDMGNVMILLDRLNSHKFMARRHAITDLHTAGMKLERTLDTMVSKDNNMLEIAALVPIPVYLKQQVHQDPGLFSSPGLYSRLLNNIIFGEVLYPDQTEARLQLLGFLTQEKYRPLFDRVGMTKPTMEHVKILAGLAPKNTDIHTFSIDVLRILESRVALDRRNRLSKRVGEFRVSLGEIFRRKES
ncbi:uncharacterized protein B0H64DRAFT_102915 [Chaetomium fimeti]|uniref:NACHT domain-containing protein n=1 Tax=Chaetomium fimeti TaxID=1854472 RepID=A0AAE0HN81_9PEZI|nr:hypothetical protein B0H64DRAFT_102915 [Chaetomium fimeti]